ncbi:MAG: ABC transporter permease [Planctomycetota bacterium]
MKSYNPFVELYKARIREFYRQPSRLFWVYGFPLLLAVILGLAFRGGGERPMLLDLVQTSSESKVASVIKSQPKKFKIKQSDQATALARLKAGKTPLVVVAGASQSDIDYHFDPTRPEAIATRSSLDDTLQRAFGRKDVLSAHDQPVTEPGSRYIDFLIPGLLGMNAMGGGLWGVGFFLVNCRIGKLLKRFKATPMPRISFLGAILASRLTYLIPDIIVLMSLGIFAFGMPMRGNWLTLLIVEVIGASAFAGLGLLVASRARTTEAVSGLMNLIMFPMWLFGGIFFSPDVYPDAIQPFIQILPLTQLLNALRAVILEGAGLAAIMTPIGVLVAWAVITFTLALKLFRWD